ncbi:MAG TPA: MFS transporter [Euzebya sp.]|nr:MFS transporter [Euzebya sp.]
MTPTPQPDEPGREGLFSPARRGVSIAIFTTVALSAFEGLAVAAALPQVAADLGRVDLLPWVFTSYLLASGVSTVAAGAMVDRAGVGRVFRGAVGVFVIAGVMAGLASSMPLLILARLIQGVGAGAINAVALSAVGLAYPRQMVGRAFAANATVWGAMSVAGPAIAAGLLTVASWRWIFLVNLPLGGAALAAGWRALPMTPPRRPEGRVPIRIDPLVLSLLSIITFASLYAVDALSWRSLPAAGVTVAATTVLLRRERGRPGALIAPRHVVDAPLGPLAWAMALMLTGSIGLATFLPLYLSAGRGLGTTMTAWSVVFFTLGWTTGANASSRLMDRMAALSVVRTGVLTVVPALAAVSLAAFATAPLPVLFMAVTAAGFGTGLGTNAALTLLRSLAPEHELGRATAAHQFIRNFGFAMGNALAGAILLLVVAAATGQVEAIRQALGEGGSAEGLAAVSAALQRGFATSAGVGAAIASLALLPLGAVARATADRPREPMT